MNLEETIRNIVEAKGEKLYDISIENENENTFFRVYLKSPNQKSVNLDICQAISKLIAPVLDVMPPLKGQYFFEVSSPGIERKLTKLEHFKLSIGEVIKIKLINGDKIKGLLEKTKGLKITIKDNEAISFDDIESAKTIFEW